MRTSVIVIGAGMGGLSGAIHLANNGFQVTVFEARSEPGGLASGVEVEGFKFDAGPYILLDRPGLEWSFERLGLQLSELIPLRSIESIYNVESMDGVSVEFQADLEQTATAFEQRWPGSGDRYKNFVRSMNRRSTALRPMLQTSRPGLIELFRTDAWRHAPFVTKTLAEVLSGTGLPTPVLEAIAIWTHVAGQRKNEAPSPLAFVPALMHNAGAYYPQDGIRKIPQTLERIATAAGVPFQYGTKISRIRSERGKVVGVETNAGEFVPANVVLSNSSALTTYLELLNLPSGATGRLKQLPLQSPGVCAYLAVQGRVAPPYLRFKLGKPDEKCRLLIQPSVVESKDSNSDWFPVRLMSPMDYDVAQKIGHQGQLEYLDKLLEEDWWRKDFTDVRVLAKRTAQQWGSDYNLYANSMNPVMTARFMRQGRVRHRSPHVRGLYLAGSSTHPGQWVSFCMISGILAADCIIEDQR
jgi:phytoene dehydrogenase-like protein